MKKIKGFKINLRFREILRFLKATANISEITLQLEEAVKREKARFEKAVKPSAVFETIPKEKIDFELGVDMPEGWIAASFFVATLGSAVEKDITDAKEASENLLEKILHSIFLEALEQSANFINRLLSDEAKEESCEISERQKVSSYAVLEKIFKMISVDKIGVNLLESKELQPQYTSCGVFFWVPNTKKKR
ncbi:MAG: hypothetical protein LHV68_11575 [Elusimicrobia bacterium]|nr:hypothetical protein [Candidatus Liberimonas magnetica]